MFNLSAVFKRKPMPSTATIHIAEDFSAFPSGRYRTDSDFSGELFRESILIPALMNNDKVVINFDGGIGYSSAFLHEAFHYLTSTGLSRNDILSKMTFISRDDPALIDEVIEYVILP